MTRNVDAAVVEGFGDEWTRFDQSELSEQELQQLFAGYFDIFPWHDLPAEAVGIDFGCGRGRWARLGAPRIGRLLCFDPRSGAADWARRMLAALPTLEGGGA